MQADTAQGKAAFVPALRDKPKRTRKELSDNEFRQLVSHVRRNRHRPASWISDLTHVDQELIDVLLLCL